MREIKFRGKRTDNGEWAFGLYVKSANDRAYIIIYATEDAVNTGNEIDFLYIEVIPETVGQFTGLYDTSGVEIYEGDIVKDGAGQINPIVFSNSTYWFNWLRLIDAVEPLTVIGNIHDKEEEAAQ